MIDAPPERNKPLRRRTALLAAIKLHRLVHLDVQPGHELARNLGNRRLMRVFRLLVSAAQADKPLLNLDLLRLVELQLRFVGEILRDRIRAQD